MDRPIENDNKIHRSLKGVLGYIYKEYTTYTSYLPYEGKIQLKNLQIWAKQ